MAHRVQRRAAERRRQGGWAAAVAAVAALLSVGLLAGPCLAAPTPLLVRIPQGMLAGLRQGPTDAFLGIPYAAPPVGRYRWRAPRPAPRWDGLRQAKRFAPSCWQVMTPSGIG
ncbi:MAG: carboxylesterase family protein, partial [Steroidobacteraceae bacterium]